MSMFSIGLSGLNAAQNALNTTSNNISNVYTPGYNREITVLNESRNNAGVRVADIERQFNTFVAAQLNNAKSQSTALETYNTQISQIDNLLADREAGLSPLMQNFFSALEDLASAPSDPAARQGVLGTADTLTAQFRSFDGYLQDLQSGVNGQIKDEITQINNTTSQIANINREIALSRAQLGEAPNSLLNQRDQLISELNEKMNLRLNIQDGKTYNLSLPNGQPLVTGDTAYKLEAVTSPNDPQRIVVGYREGARGNGNLVSLDEGLITGGSLGGLMSFRSETLDKTQNQIGQLAASIALEFNAQHQKGVDLNGEQGQEFFSIGQSNAYYNTDNKGSAEVSATIDSANTSALRATDYTVRVINASTEEFEVIRKDTGEALEADEWSFSDNVLSFAGVDVNFNDINLAQNGDSFEIQPLRRAAGGMEAIVSDLDKIAAGSLVEQSGDLEVSNVRYENALANTSESLQIELNENKNLSVSGYTGPILVNGVTLSLDANGVVQDSAGTVAVLAEDDEITIDGVSFVLADVSTEGTLTFQQGSAAAGDNRNALALQDLQSKDIVGGSASLSGAYGALVSDVGNRTNIIQVNLDARQGLTDQLRAVQQSESGVNLDEEAANLIRFQQFYQANARVIDTASTIFDTILGLRS
ncbi:flagellar hook-associated protein 1 [Vreelandella aquamarina]|uniref:Flagellar hook-associated protein 1 n=1 Tax=Vreelandella aquamarina TaxID=77097 RepID=A0A6F8XE71_9GAMM|nr:MULTISPECIES: flagellar hook-associated protein FlgK [Halomonas]MCD1652409.1 flagellar hook-associated protein FlgK [Halomonas axialensis]MCD2088708.1 flagellar hook-associated protein FlgK [Halomonas meridiana]MCP1304370.1 flagellar hook-associated protein FlgK [Halomonas sp. R1t8]MCP1330532.1 flagellar hook-associated protein FlgK [Halomonas sp. R1t4]BCB72189.1 flagellar hook-associated protein 1 [Halomonas meridiana]|tara:strand:- start:144 stop:2084 length:1941 start_codon:yes stop_codon:yes gene_type:complete